MGSVWLKTGVSIDAFGYIAGIDISEDPNTIIIIVVGIVNSY